MARRLPIYFVIDCSESMAGKPIADVERALSATVRGMFRFPHLLETAHIGVIAFAEIGKVIVRLTSVWDFEVPTLPIGAGTNLGAGLEVLVAEMETSIVRGSPDRKGDWRPIIFVMTDGRISDHEQVAKVMDEVVVRWRGDFIALYVGHRHRQLPGSGWERHEVTNDSSSFDFSSIIGDLEDERDERIEAWPVTSLNDYPMPPPPDELAPIS